VKPEGGKVARVWGKNAPGMEQETYEEDDEGDGSNGSSNSEESDGA